jgi:hypothetical protein
MTHLEPTLRATAIALFLLTAGCVSVESASDERGPMMDRMRCMESAHKDREKAPEAHGDASSSCRMMKKHTPKEADEPAAHTHQE